MPSKWIEHVKATQAKEGVTYKQAMKIAAGNYTKDTPAPVKPAVAKPTVTPVAPVKVKKEKIKEAPVVVQPPPPVAPVVEVKKVKKLTKKE
jgi:hypothetical protein